MLTCVCVFRAVCSVCAWSVSLGYLCLCLQGRARFASDAASPPPKSTRRGGGWMQALKTKRDSVAAAAEAQAAQPADTEAEDAPQQDEECTADAAQTEGDGELRDACVSIKPCP